MGAERIAVDVGIVVANMERSLGFYRGLLGLPVVAEARTSLIGEGRLVQLRYGPSRIKLVELVEAPDRPDKLGITGVCGIRYVTLLVADIVALMDKIEQAQTPIVQPLTKLGNGTQIAMFEDPDGNIVEIVQEGAEGKGRNGGN